MRRAGDQDNIDSTVNQLFVGVKTDETMIVVDRHLVRLHFFQPLAAILEPIGKDVCHGHQMHVLAGIHRIVSRSAATSSATDQPDFDHIAAGRMNAGSQRESAISGNASRHRLP